MATENKRWNPKDWQGRSRKQIESHYTMVDGVFKIAVVSFIIWMISEII
jgi:hypothetical protein